MQCVCVRSKFLPNLPRLQPQLQFQSNPFPTGFWTPKSGTPLHRKYKENLIIANHNQTTTIRLHKKQVCSRSSDVKRESKSVSLRRALERSRMQRITVSSAESSQVSGNSMHCHPTSAAASFSQPTPQAATLYDTMFHTTLWVKKSR